MADLTAEDINVLIEALEVWKDKDSSVELFDRLVESVVKTPEIPTQIAVARQTRAATKAVRVERATLLQARLIQMRMGLEAEADNAELKPPHKR